VGNERSNGERGREDGETRRDEEGPSGQGRVEMARADRDDHSLRPRERKKGGREEGRKGGASKGGARKGRAENKRVLTKV
jgi:hypothetical protein